MKFSVCILLLKVTIAAFSNQECCTKFVIFTEPLSEIANRTKCHLKLSELISLNLNETKCFNISRVLLFKPGIHQIRGNEQTECQAFKFTEMNSVVIRGQINATINCLNKFYLQFVDVSLVKIENMHIQNCICIKGYGVFFNMMVKLAVARIEMVDSKFTNSRLKFQQLYDNCSIKQMLTVRNTIIENCIGPQLSLPIIDLNFHCSGLVNITLQNINVRSNDSPFLSFSSLQTKKLTVKLLVTGSNYFTHNTDYIFGISSDGEFHFSNTEVYIFNNTATNSLGFEGSPISVSDCKVIFENSHVVLNKNQGDESGGISVYDDAKLIFNDETFVQLNNNIGRMGGALNLNSLSTRIIFNATTSNVSLNFTNNTAQRGGAIYVDNMVVASVFDLQCNASQVKLTFRDNLALFDGNDIYGGWVDWTVENNLITYGLNTMEEILNFESNSSTEVASDPIRICLCENGLPNCNINDHSKEIYGYAAQLDLVAVGQRYTPVLAYVRAKLLSNNMNSEFLGEEHLTQLWPTVNSLQENCTSITYKIYSDEEILLLRPYYLDHSNDLAPTTYFEYLYEFDDSVPTRALQLFQQLSIKLKHRNCPLGFVLHTTYRNCICQPWLLSLGLTCHLEDSKINRKIQQWVGVTYEHTTTASAHTYPGVIVHQHCPFDYCRADNESLSFQLEDQDVLCAFNRSGVLCGACKLNFSRVLGSSKCKKCSENLLLLLLIPSWLVLGLLLVFFLMFLDLTVSVGTINGLIFYANIIQAQQATFFTEDISNAFLSKFISWLNLDQGIESSLFNGLDTYTSTWLQFLFPLYIWLITAVLIVSSHYSTLVSKLSGSNAVQVLATLFLITYARLLRLIIDVISFTTITYPDGFKKAVWLIDGNVEFLGGKHIPLFVVTLLLLILSLPYTFILLSIQFLYKIPHYRVMFWVNKLKPLFDAYTGPYRANHRYWTGLLLIVRIALLTIFSLNQSNNPTINLLVVIVFATGLLIWLYFTGWVYESLLNNLFEVFFLSNLAFTSAFALFELSNNKRSPTVIYSSTGITLVIFVGIILYHAKRRLFLTRSVAKLKTFIHTKCKRKLTEEMEKTDDFVLSKPSGKVSVTVVELTQPLLEEEDCNDVEVKL